MSPLEKQRLEEYRSGRGGQYSLQVHNSQHQAEQNMLLTEQTKHDLGKEDISDWSQDFNRRSKQLEFQENFRIHKHPQRLPGEEACEKGRLTQPIRALDQHRRQRTLSSATQQHQEDQVEQQSLTQQPCWQSLVSSRHPPDTAPLCTLNETEHKERFCCKSSANSSGAAFVDAAVGALASDHVMKPPPKQGRHQGQDESEAIALLQLMYAEPQRPTWIQQLQQRCTHQPQQADEHALPEKRQREWHVVPQQAQQSPHQQKELRQQPCNVRREYAERTHSQEEQPRQLGPRRLSPEQQDIQQQPEEENWKHNQQLISHMRESQAWREAVTSFGRPAAMPPERSSAAGSGKGRQQQLLIGLPLPQLQQHQPPRLRNDLTRQQNPRENTFTSPRQQQQLHQQAVRAGRRTPKRLAEATVSGRLKADVDKQGHQSLHNRRNLHCNGHNGSTGSGDSCSCSGSCSSKISQSSSRTVIEKRDRPSNNSPRPRKSSTYILSHNGSHSYGRSRAGSTCPSKSRSSTPLASGRSTSSKNSCVMLDTTSSHNQWRCSNSNGSRERYQGSSKPEPCCCGCRIRSLSNSTRRHSSITEQQVSSTVDSQKFCVDVQVPIPDVTNEAKAMVAQSPALAASFAPATIAGDTATAAVVAFEASLTADAKARTPTTQRRVAAVVGRYREENSYPFPARASMQVNSDSERGTGESTAEGAAVALEEAFLETASMPAGSNKAPGPAGIRPPTTWLAATATTAATSGPREKCENTHEKDCADLAFSFSCVKEVDEEDGEQDGPSCSLLSAIGADRGTRGTTRQLSAADIPVGLAISARCSPAGLPCCCPSGGALAFAAAPPHAVRPPSPATAVVSASTYGVQTPEIIFPVAPPPGTTCYPSTGAAAAGCEGHVQSTPFHRNKKCHRLRCTAEHHAKKRWSMLLRRSQRRRGSSRSSSSSFCTSLSSYISSSASCSDTEESDKSSGDMGEAGDKQVIQSCELHPQQKKRHQYKPTTPPVRAMRLQDHCNVDATKNAQHIKNSAITAAVASANKTYPHMFDKTDASGGAVAAPALSLPRTATSVAGAESVVTAGNNAHRMCAAGPSAIVSRSRNSRHMSCTTRRPPLAATNGKACKSEALPPAGEIFSGEKALLEESDLPVAAAVQLRAAATPATLRQAGARSVEEAEGAAERVEETGEGSSEATAVAEPCTAVATGELYDGERSKGDTVAVVGVSVPEPAIAARDAAASRTALNKATSSPGVAEAGTGAPDKNSRLCSKVRAGNCDHVEHVGTSLNREVVYLLPADMIAHSHPLSHASALSQVLTVATPCKKGAGAFSYPDRPGHAWLEPSSADTGYCVAAVAGRPGAPAEGVDRLAASTADRISSHRRRSSAEPAADGNAAAIARLEAALVTGRTDTTSSISATGEVTLHSSSPAAQAADAISTSSILRDRMTTSAAVCPSTEAAVAAATAAAYCEVILPATVRRTLKIRMQLRRLSLCKMLQLRQALLQHNDDQTRCQPPRIGSEHLDEHTGGHVRNKSNKSPPDTRATSVERFAKSPSSNFMDANCEKEAIAAAKQPCVSWGSAGSCECTFLAGTAGFDCLQMQYRQRQHAHSNIPVSEACPGGTGGIAVEDCSSDFVDAPTGPASTADSVAAVLNFPLAAASDRASGDADLAHPMSSRVIAGTPYVNATACRFERAATRAHSAGGSSTLFSAALPERAAAKSVSGAAAVSAVSKGSLHGRGHTSRLASPTPLAVRVSKCTQSASAVIGCSTAVARCASSDSCAAARVSPPAHTSAAATSRARNIPEGRNAGAADTEQHGPHSCCCARVPRAVEQQLVLLKLVNQHCAAEAAAIALAFAQQQ